MKLSSRWIVTSATLLLVLIAVGLTAAVSQTGYWERWQQTADELDPMDHGDAVETLTALLTSELERQNRTLEAERARLLRLLEQGQGDTAQRQQIEAEIEALDREQVTVEEAIAEAQTIRSETFDVPVENASGGPAPTEPLDPTPALPQSETEAEGGAITDEAQTAGVQRLQEELEQAASQIDSLERESQRLSTALSNAERLVQQTRDRLAARDESNEQLQTQLETEAARRQALEVQIDSVRQEVQRTQARASALFASSSILAVFYQADGEVKIAVHPNHRDRVLRQATFDVYLAGSNRSTVKSRVNVQEQNGAVTFATFPGYEDPAAGDWF